MSAKNFIFWACGAICGFGASYMMLKRKYENLIQEEIESVKAVYKKNQDVKDKETEESPIDKADSIINQNGYNPLRYGAVKSIQVISPDEFGDEPDYEKIELSYYDDGFLTDDNDEIINDSKKIICDALEHFGEHEEDVVMVVNHELQVYYEIIRDTRRYVDVVSKTPYKVEV